VQLSNTKYGRKETMHTDEYYESVVAIFRKENPELCNDPERLQGEIDKLDILIDNLVKTKPETWEISVNIALQGRNPWAIILGVEKRYVDCDGAKSSLITGTKNPIPADKFVAIVCNEELVSRAINQVTPIFLDDNISYQVMTYNSCVEAISQNLVAGVVGFGNHTFTTDSLESSIRHDLKNVSGWNRKLADAVLLPPLFGAISYELAPAMEAVIQMANGTYHSSIVKDEKIKFADYKSSFLARMKIPDRKVYILIVDDTPMDVVGILDILNIWPNIHINAVEDSFQNLFPVSFAWDILLLDHDLGSKNYNGYHFHSDITQFGFNGKCISITGGQAVSYAHYHFGKKFAISQGYLGPCQDFISLINQVLETL
jgi:hypothetical protein